MLSSDSSASPFAIYVIHQLKMKIFRWRKYSRTFYFQSTVRYGTGNNTFRDRIGHFSKLMSTLIVVIRDQLWLFRRLIDELIIELIIESILESKLFNCFFIYVNLNDHKCFAFYNPFARYRIIPCEMMYSFSTKQKNVNYLCRVLL